MSPRRFQVVLAVILVLGFVARVGYVVAQPASDPTFANPMLDGRVYLEWARSMAAGDRGPEGAFYLAPLFPLVWAVAIRLFGETFAGLYLAQHVMVVIAAGALAKTAAELGSRAGGLVAAALLLGYHPVLFFGSRPLGELLAVMLLASSLLAYVRSGTGSDRSSLGRLAVCGVVLGLACMARPNLLAIAGLWGIGEIAGRRWLRIAILSASVAIPILPVTVRNLVASGHLVPISGNAGLTLYHGNGPGATGVFTPPAGFSGDPLAQRREATAIANRRSGRQLDDVEADRWWGAEALRTRFEDPAGSFRLLASRFILGVSSAEIGQDYAPALDPDPWRRTAPVPFGLILGLAIAGLVLPGPGRTGRWPVWAAVVGCATAPLVFYVSSRYRLPLAAMLCLPAGIAAAAVVGAWNGATTVRRRSVTAGMLAAAVLIASWLAPVRRSYASSAAGALSNRAVAWRQNGRLDLAARDLRKALEIDPDSIPASYNLGVVLEGNGELPGAERAYRRVLQTDSGHVEAAGNLAGILVRTGRAQAAIPLLRTALEARPDHVVSWTNLIVALATVGDVAAARAAAARAADLGVTLNPELLRMLSSLTDAPPPEREVP